MQKTVLLTVAVLASMLFGCKSAYYGAWSKMGYEKRDILVGEVEDAKTEQTKAKEQFKTTLERFQELTNFQGGELEAKYKKLSKEYDACVKRSDALSTQIADVDETANDMFKEWKNELKEYDNAELRKSSEQKLNDTKARYATLIASMKKSEASMKPVLKAFHDQVLYLKHNLNAQAISSLTETAKGIDSDVKKLIGDMEASIAESTAFIDQMKAAQ